MEEDILTLMEALTTQARDTDPDPVAAAPVGVAPPVQTLPLEGAPSTACHGINIGKKDVHQKMTEETRELLSFSPCVSAEVLGPHTDVAPKVPSSTNGGGNGGKKNSRKRRNRKKSKKVYLSWPLTLQTQACSPSPFPCQASFMGALSSKEERRKNEKKTVTLAQFWREPASMAPEASTQPSLEGISVASRKERKTQKRHYCKKRAKKNQRIRSSPWPVTVQAWASFVSPDMVQTGLTELLPAANDAIQQDVSVLTLSKGTQADILGSCAPLVQASWEEMLPDVNTKRKIKKKKKHKGGQGKKGNVLHHTWSLEIQGWAPFQTAAATAGNDGENMSLQWECWPPRESEKEGKGFIPWSEGTEEGPFFSEISPLLTSLKRAPVMKFGQSKTDKAKRLSDIGEEQLQGSKAFTLESYQSWGNTEKYQGYQHRDDWEYSILDLATPADCCCVPTTSPLFSQEGSEASIFTGSHTYASVSEVGIGQQEAEGKAKFQTLWMGKWGGF